MPARGRAAIRLADLGPAARARPVRAGALGRSSRGGARAAAAGSPAVARDRYRVPLLGSPERLTVMDLGFETIANATLICHDDGPLLATDPWLSGPAYFGSWGLAH